MDFLRNLLPAFEQFAGVLMLLAVFFGAATFLFSRWKQGIEEQLRQQNEDWRGMVAQKETQLTDMRERQSSLEAAIRHNEERITLIEKEKAALAQLYADSQITAKGLLDQNKALQEDLKKVNGENNKLHGKHAELVFELKEVKSMVSHLEDQLRECLKNHNRRAGDEAAA